MATYTTAQMLAAGMSVSTNQAAVSGPFTIEWIIDGSKKAIAAADIVNLFDIPAYSAVIIQAATVTTLAAGTATGAPEIGIAGTAATGLTAFDSATAGAQAAKLATAVNTVATTGTASAITYKQLTAGLGSGKLRIRVQGVIAYSYA
jgi:hypothetical protein